MPYDIHRSISVHVTKTYDRNAAQAVPYMTFLVYANMNGFPNHFNEQLQKVNLVVLSYIMIVETVIHEKRNDARGQQPALQLYNDRPTVRRAHCIC